MCAVGRERSWFACAAVLDDPAAAERRALAARERALAHFDWHGVVDRYAALLHALTRG
jgi:glycogen(starch) synthase